MNNVSRIFSNASKKLVATVCISAVVVLVGLIWMIKEFTLLGILPAWVGGIVAIVAMVCGVIAIFRCDDEQQQASVSAPASQAAPATASQPDPQPAPTTTSASTSAQASGANPLFNWKSGDPIDSGRLRAMESASNDEKFVLSRQMRQVKANAKILADANQEFNDGVAAANVALSAMPQQNPPAGTP